MGYSTSYELKVKEGSSTIKEIYSKWGNNEFEFEGFDYAIDENGEMCDQVKWYDHEKDMKQLSILFPDVLFSLFGEGEDNDDSWYKYFKNGKMQSCYAKIDYDEFDEDKLVE